MSVNLYLDTNVYLSFYHLSSEDLEELEKLAVLTRNKEIILFLPQQTKDEFTRNRDVKIADAINRFKDNKLNNVFPQICKDYDNEFKEMREAIKVYDKNKQIILEKLQNDIRGKSLKADKVIAELFNTANNIPIDENIYYNAKRRFTLGNPPGKKGSYGDAVNWECLLSCVDDWSELYFISDDKDYYSEYDQDSFNTFLLNEWINSKFSQLRYYRKVSQFFKENFPDIKIASEYEKDFLVNKFAGSGSFATTRRTLNQLVPYESFTTKQLNDILNAAINNNQIRWIGNDSDINENLYKIISCNEEKVDADLLKLFKEIIPQL